MAKESLQSAERLEAADGLWGKKWQKNLVLYFLQYLFFFWKVKYDTEEE